MLSVLVTLLLTSIVGGAISFSWQRRQWLFQQKFQRVVSDYDRQIAAVRDLFRLVHKRIFATRIYAEALFQGPVDAISTVQGLYRNAVGLWSEEIPGLLMQIRVHFNYQTAIEIEQTFQGAFSRLDGVLRRVRIARQDGALINASNPSVIDQELTSLNAVSRDLMAELLRTAATKKDVIEERPRISFSNEDVLSRIYLVKSLFKPR